MTIKVGQDIDVDTFLNKLVNMGYRRESVSVILVSFHCVVEL